MASRETQKLKYSEQESLDDCANLLRQLLAGLDSGELFMQRGEDSIRLHPSGPIKFSLKAKQKNGDEQVRLELRWKRNNELTAVVEPNGKAPRHVERREPALGAELSDATDTIAPKEAPENIASVMSADDQLRDTLELEDLWLIEQYVPKERLYELAATHEVAGRSGLNKSDLTRELLRIGVNPLDELPQKALYAMAQEAQIPGRSSMSREALLRALRESRARQRGVEQVSA